jgi:hypothetical protein
VFRGRGELIDHILVSQALIQRVEDVDAGPGEPPSITEDPTPAATSPPRTTFRWWPAFAWNEAPGRPRKRAARAPSEAWIHGASFC